jgi:hypothetical protein
VSRVFLALTHSSLSTPCGVLLACHDQLRLAPTRHLVGMSMNAALRIDTDHMAVTIETYQPHNWQQIPVVEVRF